MAGAVTAGAVTAGALARSRLPFDLSWAHTDAAVSTQISANAAQKPVASGLGLGWPAGTPATTLNEAPTLGRGRPPCRPVLSKPPTAHKPANGRFKVSSRFRERAASASLPC